MNTISLVIPVYNEEANINALYYRLNNLNQKLADYKLEFLFVDDCSTDMSSAILEDIRGKDNRVQVIRLSRNSGSHAALTAGLSYCRGDAAIAIAADLQDPPEIVLELMNPWLRGSKVVWGIREKREGIGLFEGFLSRTYYSLMNALTNVKQPARGADVFLIDRVVIDAFKKAPEKNTSVFMLISWLGFSQSSISYPKEARYAGKTKWSMTKKFKLFFDSLISFSYAPLRLMSLMGLIAAVMGLFYGACILFNSVQGVPVPGWSSLMIVVLLIGGLQMIMLGMLGEYLWRTYDETRGRPRYVIESNTLEKMTRESQDTAL